MCRPSNQNIIYAVLQHIGKANIARHPTMKRNAYLFWLLLAATLWHFHSTWRQCNATIARY